MHNSNSLNNTRRTLLASLIAVVGFGASIAMADESRPVLMVIANQDFHYAEYATALASLRARGLSAVVAAGENRPARPQGEAGGAIVQPDLALADASANDYSAVVFVGGWGSAQYQYGFEGTYNNSAYRGRLSILDDVNRLIKEFSNADKPVAAICHGVTVLAWARVDGVSPLRGRVVVGSAGGTPAFRDGNLAFPDAQYPARWQIESNGATMLTSGSIGNPLSTADDVYVDGKIITAENFDSAGRFAELLAQSVAANRN